MLCVLFVITLCVTLFNSCSKKEDKIPEHINQLEEYEYSDYFSSLCEFGYKTEIKTDSKCFVATQDNYITDLMSAEGVDYTTENVVKEDTYGLAFRLHFKGGARIKSIEFDFKTHNGYKYVFPSARNFSALAKGENPIVMGDCLTKGRNTAFQWKDMPHFVFKFNDKQNFKNSNGDSDSVIVKFSQTSSLLTSINYGINISNLRINFV